MKIINALILSSCAGLSTLVGSFIIFLPIKKTKYEYFINGCLTFSCVMILGISLVDLLPQGIRKLVSIYQFIPLVLIILVLLLVSIIIIKLVNKGLSHYEDNLYKLGIMAMIILILHNLPEGIITFLSTIYNLKLGIKMTIAIAIHNIPEGITIAIPIYFSKKDKKKAIMMSMIASLAEPCGALLAYFCLSSFMSSKILALILIFVAFLMINLAIEEIYPKVEKEKGRGFLWGLITGLIVILLNMVL